MSTYEEDPIIVSMTTIPNRIEHIEPVLNSILNQSVAPSKIYMNIPHVFTRENQEYIIPDFITNNDKIIINRCEDLGPITKILPIVDVVQDPDILIVSVDDDILYHSTMIEDLLKVYRSKGGTCVVSGTTGFGGIEDGTMKIEQIEGYSGVLYKKKFLEDFDKSVFENSDCKYQDDCTMSRHLKNKGIPMFATEKEYEYRSKLTFTELSENEDAMYKGANGKVSDHGSRCEKCSVYLKEKNNNLL
jgi:hypothetical protein